MQMRTSRRRITALAVAATFVLSSAVAITPSFAKTPAPTQAQIDAAKKIEQQKAAAAAAAQANLSKATQTLNQLIAVASAATAKYNAAVLALAIATKKANAAAAHAQVMQAAVIAQTQTIGKMASNAYKMGSGFSNWNSVLNANGPQDVIDRLSALNNIGASDATTLQRFKTAEAAAKVAQAAADQAKVAQATATAQVAQTKKVADDAKAAQQVEVNKLTAVQNQLASELAKARNFRLTLEQQRQISLLEEANATIALTIPGQAKIWPDKHWGGRSTIRSTDSMRAAAVAFAKVQVLARKPYLWGAQGPNSFDCSGLVYAAYHSAGLSYPKWSRLNAALYFVDTQRVPLTQLIPGDLLFYSFDGSVQNIHHITIYAGNGMMWEANSKSKGLLFSSIYSIQGLMPSGGRV
jgi:cell wall-associated NlpC family hydrolase